MSKDSVRTTSFLPRSRRANNAGLVTSRDGGEGVKRLPNLKGIRVLDKRGHILLPSANQRNFQEIRNLPNTGQLTPPQNAFATSQAEAVIGLSCFPHKGCIYIPVVVLVRRMRFGEFDGMRALCLLGSGKYRNKNKNRSSLC